MLKNALSGLGLSPEAAMITFPIDIFLPGSNIEPIRKRRQEFYEALTRWKPELASAEPAINKILSVEGSSYEDAFAKANQLFITNLWSDGLPLLPAAPFRSSSLTARSANRYDSVHHSAASAPIRKDLRARPSGGHCV